MKRLSSIRVANNVPTLGAKMSEKQIISEFAFSHELAVRLRQAGNKWQPLPRSIADAVGLDPSKIFRIVDYYWRPPGATAVVTFISD